MALFASDVKISPTLGEAFTGIGQNTQGAIGNTYNAAKKRYAADDRGLRPGGPDLSPNSYAGQRFATTQGLSSGSAASSLGGLAGDTAYKDTLAQRDYDQQRQIAEAAAEAARPSLLDQIMQGIGSGASAGLQGAAIYKQFARPNMDPRYATAPDSLSLATPRNRYGLGGY